MLEKCQPSFSWPCSEACWLDQLSLYICWHSITYFRPYETRITIELVGSIFWNAHDKIRPINPLKCLQFYCFRNIQINRMQCKIECACVMPIFFLLSTYDPTQRQNEVVSSCPISRDIQVSKVRECPLIPMVCKRGTLFLVKCLI